MNLHTILVTTLMIVLCSQIKAQNTDAQIDSLQNEISNDVEELLDTTVYLLVDVQPKFGEERGDLSKYLKENIKYPEDAQKEGYSGNVFVTVIIEKEGSVTVRKVTRGVCPSIDNEAKRVLKEMPKWKPGEYKGEPVRVSSTIPVLFRID